MSKEGYNDFKQSHIPKIAVPIISRTKREILSDAERIAASCADIAEWRVDFYEDIFDEIRLSQMEAEIDNIIGEKVLLFTCRTSSEGGEIDISAEDYRRLLLGVIKRRNADMLDVEFDKAKEFLGELTETAREYGVFIVLSYHNFGYTPEKQEIINKFEAMKCEKGSALKIAVMPKCQADADRMISAAREVSARTDRPIIPIVMGEMGKCTRIAAEAIGSFLTFGSIGSASAPGQIDAEELSVMLGKVHENITEFTKADCSEELNKLISVYCG